ncbi:substrate-binding periplasmic protein [Methylobacterium persicinum]|uniref:ABC-type amino acid transport substrate-binding protein n=1 Tax=Methylobacterium persicinum TaxID=374426 RepID=A0ABU0HRJ0_9HYPH|nr:transporter substrate-binding domain-containing protein [Methylobacterium persicinum]MDQ0444935.1 ABC-type amino acid transport substrate-binding protein [Methylobacterium persicinum]GJE40339.1 Membrane-bound lytic murein transglycosylase F [Methylobacterium persicinum]
MTRPFPRRALLAATAVLLAAALPPATAPAVARSLDAVREDGTLRVALYEDNAPFSALRDGKPAGIEVDIAQALADTLKVKLDLRLIDAGENSDGDLRLALWRGDLANSALSDVMLHVPSDRMFAQRNEQIFTTRPYLQQRLALAWRRGTTEDFETLGDIGQTPIDVEGNSASDAMLLTANGGSLRTNLKHFKSFDEAAKAFLAGDAPILAGTRSEIEGALSDTKTPRETVGITQVKLAGPIKTSWELCGAVKSDSRDLGYAIGDAMTAMIDNGTMKQIFANHGVSYDPPTGY